MEKIKTGDRVEIIGENKSRNSRIGHRGTILRKGIQGMLWLQLDDGRELVWKGIWLKKVERENYGNNLGQSGYDLSIFP
jgi:hypothetical protein